VISKHASWLNLKRKTCSVGLGSERGDHCRRDGGGSRQKSKEAEKVKENCYLSGVSAGGPSKRAKRDRAEHTGSVIQKKIGGKSGGLARQVDD